MRTTGVRFNGSLMVIAIFMVGCNRQMNVCDDAASWNFVVQDSPGCKRPLSISPVTI